MNAEEVGTITSYKTFIILSSSNKGANSYGTQFVLHPGASRTQAGHQVRHLQKWDKWADLRMYIIFTLLNNVDNAKWMVELPNHSLRLSLSIFRTHHLKFLRQTLCTCHKIFLIEPKLNSRYIFCSSLPKYQRNLSLFRLMLMVLP